VNNKIITVVVVVGIQVIIMMIIIFATRRTMIISLTIHHCFELKDYDYSHQKKIVSSCGRIKQ